MSRSYLEFDTVPYEEKCAQLGTSNYSTRARIEFHAIVAQIKRQFPYIPSDVEFKLAGCPHDFGTYYELRVYYHEGERSEEFVYDLEGNFPANWDSEALAELKTNGYQVKEV